ncbi:thyrotropin-releasing hormone receptor-like [Oppia nitens]|uniref:thyrotropin-releasing hormone receptor-like n=1 Tax=Oppia nitens TaxID=1686743 RepID=UPI0023DC3F06|nr:thyrotropin-releasing hormone receptor-like [Oppia nitens]
MVVIVVFKTRGMKTPTNCYLVSLSIADLIVLLASVPAEIVAYYLLGDKWIWGRLGCALLVFFQYFGINASSLSITAFTIERYIAICHPMRAQKICTVHRAKRIIAGVWTFAFIYCSPWLFLTKTVSIYYKGHSDLETCVHSMSRKFYKGYYFADMMLFYVLPLVLSCVLYALIARILFHNEISQKSSNKSRNGDHTGGSSDFKKTSANDASRVQVVKMLVVVVAVFATLWLPYRALVVYNSFADPVYMELWYLMFAKTMIFVNSAINPIIYSACSIKFRRAFKRMLTCKGDEQRNNARSRAGHPYTSSAVTSTMHMSHNSVRHNNTLLTVTTCAVRNTKDRHFSFSECEQNV